MPHTSHMSVLVGWCLGAVSPRALTMRLLPSSQMQKWFLIYFHGEESEINVKQGGALSEFGEYSWVTLSDVSSWKATQRCYAMAAKPR